MILSTTMTCWCQIVLMLFLFVQCHSLPAKSSTSEETMLEQLKQAHSILGKLIENLSHDEPTKKSHDADGTWETRPAELEGLVDELDRRDEGPEPRAQDVDLRMPDPQPDPIESAENADHKEDELEEEVLRRLTELLEKKRQALRRSRTDQILSHAARKRDHDIPFPFFGDY